jgi:hypothetical protein
MLHSLRSVGKDVFFLLNWRKAGDLLLFTILFFVIASLGTIVSLTFALELGMVEYFNYLIVAGEKLALFPWYISILCTHLPFATIIIVADYYNFCSGKSSGGHS